jgi:integrase
MPRQKRPEGTRAPNGAGSIYYSKADGLWHGRVIVGVRDDGSPDRRHRKAKTEKEVIKKIQDLLNARDNGTVTKAGPVWTMEKWLTHWVENISAPTVRDSTASSYRNAVYKHLIPGLGKHRIDKIQPDHFEKLYKKMADAGHKPANAHQVHRTAKTALNEAVRRGHIFQNPVRIAKPPRVEEEEIEPYSVEEVRKILATAATRRNTARWAIALALGLRQGEVLGLKWRDVDLNAGALRVRENRLRPKYAHGCGETCGRKAGYCADRVTTRPTTGPVKSRAGRRPVGVPAPLVALLRVHQETQAGEQHSAGNMWRDEGWVFTTLTGAAINPNTDYREWKDLLREAGVRDARLHDARHTAATLLLILDVTDRTTQGLMGWSDPTMPARYQHLVPEVRTDVAQKVAGLLWEVPTATRATVRQRRKKRQARRMNATTEPQTEPQR